MEYVKICGLKKFEDIQLCINNGATAVGFINGVPESPRNLEEVDRATSKDYIKPDVIYQSNCCC